MWKIDTLEYSRVKATSVSVHLWIFLFAFKISNSKKGYNVGEIIVAGNLSKVSVAARDHTRRLARQVK